MEANEDLCDNYFTDPKVQEEEEDFQEKYQEEVAYVVDATKKHFKERRGEQSSGKKQENEALRKREDLQAVFVAGERVKGKVDWRSLLGPHMFSRSNSSKFFHLWTVFFAFSIFQLQHWSDLYNFTTYNIHKYKYFGWRKNNDNDSNDQNSNEWLKCIYYSSIIIF